MTPWIENAINDIAVLVHPTNSQSAIHLANGLRLLADAVEQEAYQRGVLIGQARANASRKLFESSISEKA